MRTLLPILALLLACLPCRAVQFAESLGPAFLRAKPSAVISEGLHDWIIRGPVEHSINHIIVSEGYPPDQFASFLLDADRLRRACEEVEPLKSRVAAFNWLLLVVASKEAGADKPGGPLRDTAFGAYYGATGSDGQPTRRLIGCAPDAYSKIVKLIAGRLPRFTAFLLVNDAEYGGGGGLPMTVSVHRDSGLIGLHEWAHAFANLRDEYHIADPFPSPNVAFSLTNVPWQDMIDAGLVGAPVKIQSSPLRYRSGRPCLMQSLSTPQFCPVCHRAVDQRISSITAQP